MFQTSRYRLLLSYLAVLTVILGLFTTAVRLTFTRSLDQQLTTRLESLARASALNLGFKDEPVGANAEDDELEVDAEEILVSSNQGIQWFDAEGHLLEEQGEFVLKLPFDPKQSVQSQTKPYPAKGFTIPVHDTEKGEFVGYTRVSESTQALNDTLRSLDLGLGGGVVMALALSALGGIWLTRQAMQPIEKSFRQLQQFTADASHELRHPLTSIKASAEVMLSHPERVHPADLQKLTAIAGAADEMASLVEDLLLLARSEDKLATTRIAIPLDELLEDLVDCFQPQATAKQLQLKHQLTPAWINADSTQIKRAFTNLLANALSYTASGSITLSSVLEDDWIVVQIVDTGIGIAPDDLPHIFDRFWRADQARSRREGGTGLGLAIAQTIVQSHRGKISVQSQLGVGSRFQVELPAL